MSERPDLRDAISPRTLRADVVILCGGRGTRLGALTAGTPKPLLPIAGRPFLLHVLERLKEEGIHRVGLAVNYLAEQFKAFRAAYGRELMELELIVEPEPLGTGGALRHAVGWVRSETFVAMNGDTWLSQPLVPVLSDHARARRECTAVVVRPEQLEGRALQKGVWQVDGDDRVSGFETRDTVAEGWMNAGLYALDRAMVASWPEGRYSLEESFASLLAGRRAGVFHSRVRLLDIGTPACYHEASRWLARRSRVGVGTR